jgi:hypothetical protein
LNDFNSFGVTFVFMSLVINDQMPLPLIQNACECAIQDHLGEFSFHLKGERGGRELVSEKEEEVAERGEILTTGVSILINFAT